MKNDKRVEFKCLEENCGYPIRFSLQDIEENSHLICPKCNKEYSFSKDFINKLGKFDKLISAIRDASDILSNINIAINFEGRELRIPYRLLLTRMDTLLTLDIGGKKTAFKFRVEPLGEGKPSFKNYG